jgi:hypothetical protein
MPAAECARQILKAVAHGKREIIVGAKRERALVYLKRFLPDILARMVGRRG